MIEITDYRVQLYDYLKNRMMAIAPNLTVMVGELVGARLISHAGTFSSQPPPPPPPLAMQTLLIRTAGGDENDIMSCPESLTDVRSLPLLSLCYVANTVQKSLANEHCGGARSILPNVELVFPLFFWWFVLQAPC